MREIKFRAKKKNRKKKYQKWVYGNLYTDVEDCFIMYRLENGDIEFESCIKETIGQFTGLYDKNNTPIYEGDLIKYACGGTEDDVIQEIDEVFFNNEYGTFEIAINKNKENSEVLGFWLAGLYEDSFYQVKVIGNIYDNEVEK